MRLRPLRDRPSSSPIQLGPRLVCATRPGPKPAPLLKVEPASTLPAPEPLGQRLEVADAVLQRQRKPSGSGMFSATPRHLRRRVRIDHHQRQVDLPERRGIAGRRKPEREVAEHAGELQAVAVDRLDDSARLSKNTTSAPERESAAPKMEPMAPEPRTAIRMYVNPSTRPVAALGWHSVSPFRHIAPTGARLDVHDPVPEDERPRQRVSRR